MSTYFRTTHTIGIDHNDNYSRKKLDFKLSYNEVKWIDVKIDKISKQIDVTLRVNLKDGGEIGTEKDCKKEVKIDYLNPGMKTTRTVCPWDKIPKIQDRSGNDIDYIKNRLKTYEELKKMVLDGINTYWSRRYTNTQGTIINNANWEVIVTAVNTNDSKISLNDIPLIYNTNSEEIRSGNPGTNRLGDGSTLDELVKLVPDGIIQRIGYNIGYIYELKYYETWGYESEENADEKFKRTSAHEIGHEILQSFANTVYSWQHKGSSYYLPQNRKPVGKESLKEEYWNRDFMEETSGEYYPTGEKEIDLMKYYHGKKPEDYFTRCVANENDVLGLLWLTKIVVK